MASPTELDVFSRSLGGDRRARIELYKKYFRDNSRVCRMGAGYAELNDFLHDCFGNLLRTGHSWDKESSLSRWVESVAVWTALINERQRDMNARGAAGAIRMCAEIEGDDANRGQVLSSYAPPVQEPEDSPASRILNLLNEPDRAVFRKRVMENASWEEIASAVGKPVNTLGPAFARALVRTSRLLGAPPPMDDDLVPVFSRAAANPQIPEGRAIALQLDASFYAISPELKKIGVATAYDTRMLVLWDTALSSTPPADALRQHLDECHYCADLLRSLILLERAIVTPPGVPFQLCPGAFTLANAEDLVREAFDQHLAQCANCRKERTQVLDGQTPRSIPDAADDETRPAGVGRKIGWVAAALVVLGAGSFAGYHYLSARQEAASQAAAVQSSEPLTPTVSIDPKYQDLVQNVPFDDARMLASVLPANRPFVKYAIDQFSMGQPDAAVAIGSELAGKRNDPGVQMVYAMSLYKTRLMTDGYREMLKSESMEPRDSFRCWIMFQFSLMVGDRKVIDREAEHLSTDPQFKDKAKAIMNKVRERG